MEILIPGLILVALMVWASTKIKKSAAAAFESELIETDEYSLRKPDGFLHVIGSTDHAFEAYSKEMSENEDSSDRRATIELDVFPKGDFQHVCDSLREGSGTRFEETSVGPTVSVIETEEPANETTVSAVYKIVGTPKAVFRLRFAVLAKHLDEYRRKIDETLESFGVSTI